MRILVRLKPGHWKAIRRIRDRKMRRVVLRAVGRAAYRARVKRVFGPHADVAFEMPTLLPLTPKFAEVALTATNLIESVRVVTSEWLLGLGDKT